MSENWLWTEESLRAEYRRKGPNFITPCVLSVRFDVANARIVELSEGSSILDRSKMVYGVTVWEYDNMGRRIERKSRHQGVYFDKEVALKHYRGA